MRVAVVGSGHGAVAAASALVERGISPVILDVGETPPEAVAALTSRLASAASSDWAASDLQRAKPTTELRSTGVPRKLYFGSDYFYGNSRPYARSVSKGTAAVQTYARGGFSVAWGGCMLPACDSDISDWPISLSDLEPHYRGALAHIPLSARQDGLADLFPLYKEGAEPIQLDPQSRGLLDDLSSIDPKRLRKGTKLYFGQSRVAVRAQTAAGKQGCKYCGICLAGCPYGALYTANELLDSLIQRGKVIYRPHIYVHSVKEDEEGAVVTFFELDGKGGMSPGKEKFANVFIAAGTIGSARIAMESVGWYDKPLVVKDCSKFAIPLIRAKSAPFTWPNSNTFPSVFIEALFEDLSPHPLHMQISPTNDVVLNALRTLNGRKLNWFGVAAKPILRRLMTAFCSIHSNHSGQLELKLSKGQSELENTLSLSANDSADTKQFMKKLCRRLDRTGYAFNAQFVSPLARFWEPGVTGQCGGSFPMRRNPVERFETDLLGRPAGMNRVHLVDASVFPSIPGPTIGLTIMANARRIASETPL